ncbi:MAG: hypothetical protein D6770_11335 [Anaerolineae bacterium]|nr:MAG: hypothetical protein D6770_11335 [Anaerolineae bacterium]
MAFSMEFLSGALSFLLTLLVLSYLIGDNPLFRLATYTFVGVSAGYVAAVAWHYVLWPELFLPLLSGALQARLLLLPPLVLAILLLARLLPPLEKAGRIPLAFLAGVAAAVAVGGAVTGTLLPQARAVLIPFDVRSVITTGASPLERLFEGAVALVGVVSALVYFHFGARRQKEGNVRRSRINRLVAWVGRLFIAVTFGALFAGVYAAALTALIERLMFLWTFLRSF